METDTERVSERGLKEKPDYIGITVHSSIPT